MKTSSRAAVLAAILSGYGCSLHEAPDPELGELPSMHVVRSFDDMGLAWRQRRMSYGDVWRKSGALPEETGAQTASFTAYIAFIEGSDDGVVVMANGPFGDMPSDDGVGWLALDILEAIAD